MTGLVDYARADAIALIRLDRPGSLNALTAELVDELVTALESATAEGVAAVIITGNGRAFCAGHDLYEIQDPADEDLNRHRLERLQDITRVIRHAPQPVIAAVHGYALGAGFEIVLSCDLVICTPDATFGFPEVSVGLSVTGGVTRLLPAMIGPARAKELILLGARIPAPRAQELGLVNEIVEADALLSRAWAIAARLAGLPQASLRAAKRAIDAGLDAELDAAMDHEVASALALIGVDQGDTTGDTFRARRS